MSGRAVMDFLWKSGANSDACQPACRQEGLEGKRLRLCQGFHVSVPGHVTEIEIGGLNVGRTILFEQSSNPIQSEEDQ